MKRPTIADIARRAGVSKVAVSYALNGQPGVSETTRATIMAIAEEIGWRPNSAARALNGARARSIGLALCRPARILGVEPFFMELISGIQDELSAQSYALMFQVVRDHTEEMDLYRRWWGEGRIDGAILVDLHLSDPRVAVTQALRMPAVVIGHPSEAGSLTPVWSDDGAAVRETVRYLAALGHRRLARVAGLPRLVHTVLRDRAFTEVCEELGLDGHVIVHTDYTGEQGARATRRLLSAPGRPSAVVYDNDIMAVAGLSVAQELRLDVPGDLSVVAWDDSPLSQVVRPPLTALSRDIPAYGGHAARALMSLIAGERVAGFEDAAPQLTPRGSTGAPARA
ncbi:DNA-binding LacI/PurR family transcriptional regulator [Streptosporangium becharense]|uniref:DNA-binding LacI/PurR family transcriptional regulator n=1 Tax=Streptosporangium becharense TaxID=1816182 RepID=A0A7W9MEK4_9ACTN|nr:LacI family DNA-binding transcriptional regulator [Streptosporangium becharense]MBB2910729.1 DNA-binding LacI/PurR family transcriptional regulator [Streptosporangium becharense]MBB5817424.1 DNA-binding LacI/PurR family transcriptional regulator [Streptosporangium becharense]